jgi:23S rRNA (pseudouridine1915-N3)-methyltransferase
LRITLACVGRPGATVGAAIREYELRAARYWSLDVVEVKEEKARKGMPEVEVRDAEAVRIMKRVPKDAELVALTRSGEAWGSTRFAGELQKRAALGGADVAFIIGGAFGLGEEVMKAARQRMQLSTFTMPHDLARLVLLEQIYRAGTILRNEPYHKGSDGG